MSLSITSSEASRLLDSFTNFLTVAIHSIVYYRNIYPKTSFLTARAYNLPVHQSRHPGVCQWINDAVVAASEQLRIGAADAIVLVIHASQAKESKVLERWVFDVSEFPATFGDAKNSGKEQQEVETLIEGDNVAWADVDEALRGALRRIAYTGESKPPLEEGCSFTVAIELRDKAIAPTAHPQAWIPTEPDLQPPSETHQSHGSARGGDSTSPIRSVQAGPLFFECWLEQSAPEVKPANNSINTSKS